MAEKATDKPTKAAAAAPAVKLAAVKLADLPLASLHKVAGLPMNCGCTVETKKGRAFAFRGHAKSFAVVASDNEGPELVEAVRASFADGERVDFRHGYEALLKEAANKVAAASKKAAKP